MTLILTVEAGGAEDGPESPYRVEGDMIVVGRSRNCDWCLPDPSNAISSRHCEIRRDGDAWYAEGHLHQRHLPERQRRADGRGAQARRGATGCASASMRSWRRSRPRRRHARCSCRRQNLAAPSPAEPSSRAAGHAEPAPEPAAEAAPPRAEPAPEPAAEAAPPPAPEPAPSPACRARARAGASYARARRAAPAPEAAADAVPDNVTVMWDSLADINKVDWERGGFGVKDEAAPMVTDLATVDGIVAQLIEAAAIGDTNVRRSPELIAKAGSLLKRLVSGLLVMVEARARAKAQMGAELTGLQLEGNNPIKFARTPEQALAQLLNPPESGFMDSDKAVEDAYLDLQSHQVATLKAIPGALRATLDRFSPGSVRRRRGGEHRRPRQIFRACSATPRSGAITSRIMSR